MNPDAYQATNPIINVPLEKKGKYNQSKQIVKESWAILQKDKEIIWFPVLSMISSLILCLIMAVIFFFTVLQGDVNQIDQLDRLGSGALNGVEYVYLFVYYLISFFIINFFQTGILIIVDGRVNGKDLNFKDGINGSKENFGKIFIWSFISATVGVILNFLVNHSKIIGKIVGWVLGTAWTILTYFSLPSLIIGKKSVTNSFRESADLIRKTWGEALIINLGVGLFFFTMILGVITLGGILAVFIPLFPLQVLIFIAVALFVLGTIVISSALSVIFKLALYEYARTGTILEGFSPELVKNAIQTEKK